MTEFCIAEFALAIGRSTDAGRAVIAAAVELKYRLPRPGAGCRPVTWRPGGPAGSPKPPRALPRGGGVRGRPGRAVRAPIRLAALSGWSPRRSPDSCPTRPSPTSLQGGGGSTLHHRHQQVSFVGTSQIRGELDLADALDLEAALAEVAETLRHWVRPSPSTSPILRRRPARPNQLALDLAGATTVPQGGQRAKRAQPSARRRRAPPPRQVVLYVHLSDAAITGTSDCLELARVENQRQVVTADQIRTLVRQPRRTDHREARDRPQRTHPRRGYEVPDRSANRPRCGTTPAIFPWCNRSARRTDADQVIPYAEGGTREQRQHRAAVHDITA